ncbi:MAG TPA: NnrS family protein, partial [Sphingomicrobium sp.]|nr:NnrS family protein [Sphingomicrobium sp.]
MSKSEPPAIIPTRGEQMLKLRKKRMAAAPPFLRGGFRPFFFGAATFALIGMTLWLAVLWGLARLPSGFYGAAWHRHEMLFGFVGAAVSGFLLTAIPNWTGRLPIAGKPLLLLFALWALARVFVLVSGLTGMWLAAIFDVGLFLALSALALREVVASKNRNMAIVALVFLLGLADAADYLGTAGFISADIGWRGAVALMVIMISMIGGRIIPSFTRNWMVKRGALENLPTQPQRFDLLVIASTAISLFFWLGFADHWLTGVMLVLAAGAQTLRLVRWSGHRTGTDPLVLILHVGYA